VDHWLCMGDVSNEEDAIKISRSTFLMQHVAIIVLFILMFSVVSSFAETSSEDLSGRFDRLKRDRRQILDDLALPIEQCVQRRDTRHIAFHGCIDWHSSVHGMWALVKYTSLTGDTRYRSLIESVLNPEKVNAEFKHLRQDRRFEMPYGRAWFLRLTMDHKQGFGSETLIPMGDYVAGTLKERYRRSPPRPLDRDYDNASWALINLYEYGVSRRSQAMIAFVQELIRKHFAPIRRPCPVGNEENLWPDFLPVCTTWAHLVALALPSSDLADWLKKFFPPDAAITPIKQPRNSHHMGMNFSRAWGLWRLFKATKDSRYLRLYLDHFELQYNEPSWWKGDYRAVGHWVPQFGVFALAPVFSE
jgi:hypothetical protein